MRTDLQNPEKGNHGKLQRLNASQLRIIHYPDPVLRKKASPVVHFDEALRELARRMLELMRQAKGVGLAAPQVGVLLRLFVCNATGQPGDDQVIVNPRFLELSGSEEAEEGCLSIPEVRVCMRRAKSAVMEAQSVEGRTVQLSGSDLLARIWQHETDHLNGRLIVDAMSAADEITNRRALQRLKDEYKRARRKRS